MRAVIDLISDYLPAAATGLIILSVFVEISPIKFNPLQWLGNCLFAGVNGRISAYEKKLDEHIAESYRDSIFMFQDRLLENKPITKERFQKAIKACDRYESYIEENEMKNGEATDAIGFIREEFTRYKKDRAFVDLPKVGQHDATGK